MKKPQHRDPYMPTSDLILQTLPSFCWQTSAEIFDIMGKLYPSMSRNSVENMLIYMARKGQIDRREGTRFQPSRYGSKRYYRHGKIPAILYKAKSNPGHR